MKDYSVDNKYFKNIGISEVEKIEIDLTEEFEAFLELNKQDIITAITLGEVLSADSLNKFYMHNSIRNR